MNEWTDKLFYMSLNYLITIHNNTSVALLYIIVQISYWIVGIWSFDYSYNSTNTYHTCLYSKEVEEKQREQDSSCYSDLYAMLFLFIGESFQIHQPPSLY